MNKKILISVLVAVASLLTTTGVGAADVKGYDLEIILDSSGSMAENLGGKTKMAIAKEAIQSVVGEIPDGSYVGFRAYGHQFGREAKNCTDSQLIFPIGKINKSELVSKVNSLTPRGWTPIDYSLRQAQNDFPVSAEYQKMIILVSDGEETCGGNPCQAVKDMKAAGFNVTVNTVGFAVGTVAREQLKCIAAATGGEYKDASNASELAESMRVFSKRAFQSYTTSGTTEAGTGFNNAPLVTPGIYGGDILPEETKFYKFSVLKGQDIGASLSIKREKSINGTSLWDIGCADFVPSVKIYDSLMAIIGEKAAVGTEEIRENDTSPHAYAVSPIGALKKGEYYVAVSNDWVGGCNAGGERESQQKKYSKAFYDVKITVEGVGEAEPVASTSKKVTDSNASGNLADSDNTDNTLDDSSSVGGNPSGSTTTRNIIIGVVVLIFLGGIGAVVFFVMKNKNSGVATGSISFNQGVPQNNSAPVAPRVNPFNAPVAPVATASPTGQAPGEKFCTKCGTKNSPDKAFCVSCGGKL